ncbi:dienelactone hydrolase family protein [Saccharopolyspora oryzae]|uniref:Dienelactone hydrolase family protein n=1 Tax=Saccharopolyspora oryzae TaxID=2997343 RepID=A0ABT4VB84_9PSEU|nr:dienelactone hydrolase family protein [Saccharopolyspora oryzae]MDA3630646.1 dienelactone hydrolase family protein [Saccharopolyspora oryzae]
MTETRTETIALTDGTELRLTVAEPDNVVRGGLVFLHEARGVTERVRGLSSALAEEGWLTVVPHLYHDGDPDRVRKLSGESILADTDASFLWLSDQGVPADRQGIIGFDIGGSAALVVAASRTLGAAVSVGGRGILEPLTAELPPLVEIAGELSSPWLGLYGDDEGVEAGDVDKLREVADSAPAVTDVVRYPGAGHRFDRDPEAAAEAWRRARNWLDHHLR